MTEPIIGSPTILQPKKVHAGHKIDLVRVEELAALGMPQQFIADDLGISRATFQRWVQGNKAFESAYKRGIAQRRVKILTSLSDGMEKSFIPAIFLAKQPHLLGFQDVQQRQVTGELKLVIEERILHPPKQINPLKSKAEDVELE